MSYDFLDQPYNVILDNLNHMLCHEVAQFAQACSNPELSQIALLCWPYDFAKNSKVIALPDGTIFIKHKIHGKFVWELFGVFDQKRIDEAIERRKKAYPYLIGGALHEIRNMCLHEKLDDNRLAILHCLNVAFAAMKHLEKLDDLKYRYKLTCHM